MEIVEDTHSVSLVFPKQDHEIDGFIGIHFPFWWPFLKEAGNICWKELYSGKMAKK